MTRRRPPSKTRRFGSASTPVGTLLPNRSALMAAAAHRSASMGVCGSAATGVESLLLPSGYEDDLDLGAVIISTGRGGRNAASGEQIAGQSLSGINRAFARNRVEGIPLRVSRAVETATGSGMQYRYDGLYYVDDFWMDVGRSGHRIFRFRLLAADTQVLAASALLPAPLLTRPPGRSFATALDTQECRWVKLQHSYKCQACGMRTETALGPYAEALHIRPLGPPHNGPDTRDNIVCLCPYHRIQFELGVFTVSEDLSIQGFTGPARLLQAPGHRLSAEHLSYRRLRWAWPEPFIDR